MGMGRSSVLLILVGAAACGRVDDAAPAAGHDASTIAPDAAADASNDACSLAPELALSPRDDEEAERLTYEAAGTLGAATEPYERVRKDLTTIRASFPEVSSIHARGRGERSIYLGVDDAGFAAIDSGAYHAWDCLNAHFGTARFTATKFSNSKGVDIFMGRRFDVRLALPSYRALPNVLDASGDALVGDGDDVCAAFDGTAHAYLFKKGEGDCPSGCITRTYWGFSTNADGKVTPLGTWTRGSDPAPTWPALASCVARI